MFELFTHLSATYLVCISWEILSKNISADDYSLMWNMVVIDVIKIIQEIID